MSGHNKWSSIKHKKGAIDAKRGKIFTKIIKEVTIAARMGGGDPAGNPRLRRAIDLAKANNMPADNLARAIKKGTGELEGVNYEDLRYEGKGPGATLVVANVTTDNRNRTAAEIRKVFDKHQGVLGAANSAGWAFDEKGWISLTAEGKGEEEMMELAADAGAEDVQQEDEQWVITTAREELDAVCEKLKGHGLNPQQAEIRLIAKTPKEISGKDAEQLTGLLEALDDHDDVQNVFTDAVFVDG